MTNPSTIISATSRSLRIEIGDDGAPATIYAGPRYGGDWVVEVNWSAIGSVTPETAASYAATIQVAAETASWLEDQIIDTEGFSAAAFARSLLGNTLPGLDIIEISTNDWVWTQANGLDTGTPATMKGGE